jgi:hypothetical protein
VRAAVRGGVDHLPAAPGEDRLRTSGTDERDRERGLSRIHVQRRPIRLPRLAAVGRRRRILRLAVLDKRVAAVGVDEHPIPIDLRRRDGGAGRERA